MGELSLLLVLFILIMSIWAGVAWHLANEKGAKRDRIGDDLTNLADARPGALARTEGILERGHDDLFYSPAGDVRCLAYHITVDLVSKDKEDGKAHRTRIMDRKDGVRTLQIDTKGARVEVPLEHWDGAALANKRFSAELPGFVDLAGEKPSYVGVLEGYEARQSVLTPGSQVWVVGEVETIGVDDASPRILRLRADPILGHVEVRAESRDEVAERVTADAMSTRITSVVLALVAIGALGFFFWMRRR